MSSRVVPPARFEERMPAPRRADQGLARDAIAFGVALLSMTLIASFALWYGSSGRFPGFPEIRNDYVDLGRAFLEGKLALLDDPDPRLAELGNPYEYSQRKGIPIRWDASYFGGRYYLYWGPAPALVSALIQLITGAPPPASVLVLVPYLGLMGEAAALLFLVSDAFGRRVRLSISLFLLIGFFNLPMLFTLGQPRHYQTSIFFGQFFLLGGLLLFVLHTRDRRRLWLALAGLAWGLALASRYNLAASIVVCTISVLFWLWRDRWTAFWIRSGLLLLGPAMCVLALGLYNFARFGNVFETGLSYQLTIPQFGQMDFSPAYVPSGLYIYLLYPLRGAQAFPFIYSPHFSPKLLPATLSFPSSREFDQIVFGLLPTVPAVSLLALAVPLVFAWLPAQQRPRFQQSAGAAPGFILAMLAASALSQFAFLLVFFYVAERYIVDFYVPVALCLAFVVWMGHVVLQTAPILRYLLWLVVGLLALWTAAIGYFACFGVPVLVSLHYDPQMIAELGEFWNGVHSLIAFP